MKLDMLDLSADEIARRFRWAREQGHPAYLWPDLPFDVWRACLREIEHTTRAVLRGSADASLRIPIGATPKAMGIAGFTSGLGPLLGYWCADGQIQTDAGTRAIFDLHLQHGRVRSERLLEELERVVALLDAEDVAVTLTKGAHTAWAFFPDAGTRPMADLDLIVTPDRLDDATRLLTEAGYHKLRREARPYRSNWRPPGAPTGLRSIDLTHLNNIYTVDLHTSLDRNFFGVRTLSFGSLTSIPTEAAGHVSNGLVLPQPYLVAVLAAHASEGLHNLTMLRLVELVLVIRTDLQDDSAWAGLAELIERLDAGRLIYPAFALVEKLVPRTVQGAFLETLGHAAPPRMRRILETLEPHAAQQVERLSMDERFMWGSSIIDHLRRVLHMLWPAPASRSLRDFRRIYAERLYRLSRGRVSLKGAGSNHRLEDAPGTPSVRSRRPSASEAEQKRERSNKGQSSGDPEQHWE
ncbi:MAG: nucleotidyltransferase family protein [Gemmatimonadetes bacterium]|nr:nucleotidyltransferase family protein [Gemmatimonadota bacterium]